MEFNALLNRAAKEWDLSDTASIPTASLAVTKAGGDAKIEAKEAGSVAKPGAVFDRARLLNPINRAGYETVTDEAILRRWLARIDEDAWRHAWPRPFADRTHFELRSARPCHSNRAG